jgi:hypothetical protein
MVITLTDDDEVVVEVIDVNEEYEIAKKEFPADNHKMWLDLTIEEVLPLLEIAIRQHWNEAMNE